MPSSELRPNERWLVVTAHVVYDFATLFRTEREARKAARNNPGSEVYIVSVPSRRRKVR